MSNPGTTGLVLPDSVSKVANSFNSGQPGNGFLLANRINAYIDYQDYGAIHDVIEITDGAITAGDTHLTCNTSSPFTSTAVDGNKIIHVVGAGAAGAGLLTTIVSVVNSSTVIVNTAAGTTVANAKVAFGTDNAAAYTNAHAAAKNGQELVIPFGTGFFSAFPDITKPIRVRGHEVFEVAGSYFTDGGYGPTAAPWLIGSVLLIATPATNGIRIIGRGISPRLHDFGIRFADAIAFNNTGAGIAVRPSVAGDVSTFKAKIHDILIFGHDGNHAAIDRVNSHEGSIARIGSYGGGLLLEALVGTGGSAFYIGNCSYHDIKGVLFCGGTAHNVSLSAGGTGTFNLNLLRFVNPQIDIINPPACFAAFGITNPSAAQYLWQTTTNVIKIVIQGNWDFEGYTYSNPINFGGEVVGGHEVSDQGIGSTFPVGGYSRGSAIRQAPLGGTPTLTAGSGSGTSPSLSVSSQSNDRKGIISDTAGTTPPAAPSDLFTMTFQTLWNKGVVNVGKYFFNATNMVGNPGIHAYTSGAGAAKSTASVMYDATLTAAANYQISYSAESQTN